MWLINICRGWGTIVGGWGSVSVGKAVRFKVWVGTGVRVGVAIRLRVLVRVRTKRAGREVERKRKKMKKRTKCFYSSQSDVVSSLVGKFYTGRKILNLLEKITNQKNFLAQQNH